MGLRTGSTAGISFIYCSNRLKKASEGFLEQYRWSLSPAVEHYRTCSQSHISTNNSSSLPILISFDWFLFFVLYPSLSHKFISIRICKSIIPHICHILTLKLKPSKKGCIFITTKIILTKYGYWRYRVNISCNVLTALSLWQLLQVGERVLSHNRPLPMSAPLFYPFPLFLLIILKRMHAVLFRCFYLSVFSNFFLQIQYHK